MENLAREGGEKISLDRNCYYRNSNSTHPKKSDADVDLEIDKLMIEGSKEIRYIPFPSKNIYSKNDFEVLELLGKGAYAKVVKAKCLKDNIIKSIKIIDKQFMERVNKNLNKYNGQVLQELHCLSQIGQL